MRTRHPLALALRLMIASLALLGALLACSTTDGNVSVTRTTVNVPFSGMRTFVSKEGTIDPTNDCQPPTPPNPGLAPVTVFNTSTVIAGFQHWRNNADGGACTESQAFVYRGYFMFDLTSLINTLTATPSSATPATSTGGGLYAKASLEFDFLSTTEFRFLSATETSSNLNGTVIPNCAQDIEFVTGSWSTGSPDPNPFNGFTGAFPTTSQINGSQNTPVNMTLPGTLPLSGSVNLNNGTLQIDSKGHVTMDITDVVRAWLPSGGTTAGRNLPNLGLAFTSVPEPTPITVNSNGIGTPVPINNMCLSNFGNFKLTVTLIS